MYIYEAQWYLKCHTILELYKNDVNYIRNTTRTIVFCVPKLLQYKPKT